jgi:hypothetical protein
VKGTVEIVTLFRTERGVESSLLQMDQVVDLLHCGSAGSGQGERSGPAIAGAMGAA